MIARVRPLLRLLQLAAVVSLAACAETRYEGATTSTAAAGAATVPTSAPEAVAGRAAELLPVLVAEGTDLSRRMIEDDDPAAAAVRIDLLWQAVRDEVDATRPELVADFEANVRRITTAVEFDRAADADKAGVNLGALVDAYLGSERTDSSSSTRPTSRPLAGDQNSAVVNSHPPAALTPRTRPF